MDEQVTRRRYGSTSEYVRDLIRRDPERTGLRDLLLAVAASEPSVDVDDAFLVGLDNGAGPPGGHGRCQSLSVTSGSWTTVSDSTITPGIREPMTANCSLIPEIVR